MIKFATEYKHRQSQLNHYLVKFFPTDVSRVNQAAFYSLTTPGKRLRPMLALGLYQALSNAAATDTVWRAVCSLEYTHVFSLIHDDLPAIDNDQLRHALPTCHCQFDEATAILAGDYLLAVAQGNLTELREMVPMTRLALQRELSAATMKLIAGEMLDIEGETKRLSKTEVKAVCQMKTGALFSASGAFAGHLAAVDGGQLRALRSLGLTLGLAFQIQDDILDVLGEASKLGKAVGKDQQAHKSTWVSVYGLARAQADCLSYYQRAQAKLEDILPDNPERDFCRALLTFLQNREV